MSDAPHFDPAQLATAANDNLTVRRVFGEAYERDGVLVIPVARVSGATGMGSGGGEGDLPSGPTFGRRSAESGPPPERAGGHGGGHGGGGGYAAHVKAVGVFVVDEAGVHWRPTLDLNRVILGGQVVVATTAAVVAFAWAFRRRR